MLSGIRGNLTLIPYELRLKDEKLRSKTGLICEFKVGSEVLKTQPSKSVKGGYSGWENESLFIAPNDESYVVVQIFESSMFEEGELVAEAKVPSDALTANGRHKVKIELKKNGEFAGELLLEYDFIAEGHLKHLHGHGTHGTQSTTHTTRF